eukprot:s3436_g12.t1
MSECKCRPIPGDCRNCSTCRTAELPKDHSSFLAEVRKQDYGDLGSALHRTYAWSAKLFPMRCEPQRQEESPELPAMRLAPTPQISRAFCSPTTPQDLWGTEWDKRSCRFEGLCYDVGSRIFEFYGDTNASSPSSGTAHPAVGFTCLPHTSCQARLVHAHAWCTGSIQLLALRVYLCDARGSSYQCRLV